MFYFIIRVLCLGCFLISFCLHICELTIFLLLPCYKWTYQYLRLKHWLFCYFVFCKVYTALHPTDKTISLTMFTGQLSDLPYYIDNLLGLLFLDGDMSIHFDNPLHSLTKQTLTNLSIYGLVQVIHMPAHKCVHFIDWVLFDLMTISIGKQRLPTH